MLLPRNVPVVVDVSVERAAVRRGLCCCRAHGVACKHSCCRQRDECGWWHASEGSRASRCSQTVDARLCLAATVVSCVGGGGEVARHHQPKGCRRKQALIFVYTRFSIIISIIFEFIYSLFYCTFQLHEGEPV